MQSLTHAVTEAMASKATRKRRGRPINPASKRQQKIKSANEKRQVKRFRKLAGHNCDPSMSRCTCEDFHGYVADDVNLVHTYLDGLVRKDFLGHLIFVIVM